MKKRSVLNSPRLKEFKREKRAKIRNKILLVVILTAAFLALFSALASWKKINVQEVQVSGNKIIDTEDIKSVVAESTAGKYLWIVPRTNFFVYPRSSVEKNIAERFKRLKDIKLNVTNAHTLEISVGEREPSYTWCGESLPELENQKCYFMDKSGYIFDEAPYFSGDVYFKFYGKTPSQEEIPSGNNFSEENFEKLISFKTALEQVGLTPVALYIVGDGDIRIFLSSLGSSMGPAVMFKADADFNKLAENLQAALATEPFHTDFKKKYASLEYLDLRFGNKVYYKFTGLGAHD